jgi:hypothetical protein
VGDYRYSFWSQDAGGSVCAGDSGGPLLTTIDGQERVIGVTADRTRSCPDLSGSNAFARVDRAASWILYGTVPNPKPPTALGPPHGFKLPPTDGAVQLSWAYESRFTRYALRVVDLTDNAYNTTRPLGGNTCGIGAHYVCRDVFNNVFSLPVVAGHRYSWWLHGCNASGCSEAVGAHFEALTPQSSIQQPVGIISPPNGGKATISDGKVSLAWTAMNGVTHYALRAVDATDDRYNTTFRYAGNTCGNVAHYLCLNVTSSSTFVMPAVANHVYTWWIHPCNATGCGPPTIASFTAVSAQPTVPGPTSFVSPVNDVRVTAYNGLVPLLWTSVQGATHYAVRVNDETDFRQNSPLVLGSTYAQCGDAPHYICRNWSGTSFHIPVIRGHRYTWWMHACNAVGCGLPNGGSFWVN